MKRSRLKQEIHQIQLKAEKALKKAVAGVIRDHLRTRDPVVVWQGGKVVHVPAGRILGRRKKGK